MDIRTLCKMRLCGVRVRMKEILSRRLLEGYGAMVTPGRLEPTRQRFGMKRTSGEIYNRFRGDINGRLT